VGPNGCGKSVFGEAIAFALGGSKRMLRVQNLSSLINERVMRSDNPVAEVGTKSSCCILMLAHFGQQHWFQGCGCGGGAANGFPQKWPPSTLGSCKAAPY
jgi:hypothetical protein